MLLTRSSGKLGPLDILHALILQYTCLILVLKLRAYSPLVPLLVLRVSCIDRVLSVPEFEGPLSTPFNTLLFGLQRDAVFDFDGRPGLDDRLYLRRGHLPLSRRQLVLR